MFRHEFVHRVNTRCEEFLEQKRQHLELIDAKDACPLVDSLLALTSGGKKLRPVLAWLGFRAARGTFDEGQGAGSLTSALTWTGVGLELFQAAALIHDDVIDRSDTRRGQPSTHRRFEALHARHGYDGDRAHFGTTGAVLAGDLALAWANEAFTIADQQAGIGEIAVFPVGSMHTEVITGQYLDVLAEVRPPAGTEAEALRRARTVLRYKAARYSTVYPMELGMTIPGGSWPLREALERAAQPLGEAFQLRDDLLGVFGDSEITGKPVGDDLREGKRTELIAYGLFRSPAPSSAELEAMLGDPDLGDSDIDRARTILSECGAVTEVERSIAVLTETSAAERAKLAEHGVPADVVVDFDEIAQQLTTRSS